MDWYPEHYWIRRFTFAEQKKVERMVGGQWQDSMFRWHNSGKATDDRVLGLLGECAVMAAFDPALSPEMITKGGKDGGIDGFMMVGQKLKDTDRSVLQFLTHHTITARVPYQVKTRGLQTSLQPWELDLFFDCFPGAAPASQFKAAITVLAVELPKPIDCGMDARREIAVAGWITRSDFVQRYRDVDYGHGVRAAVVFQDDLLPPAALAPWLQSLSIKEIGLLRGGNLAYSEGGIGKPAKPDSGFDGTRRFPADAWPKPPLQAAPPARPPRRIKEDKPYRPKLYRK